MNNSTMKNKIKRVFNQPYMVVVTIVIATLLSFSDRNYGYFYGIFVVFLILWSDNYRWSDFGFGKRIQSKTIIMGFLLAIVQFIVIDVFTQPFLEIYFGTIDLSSLDSIRGNFASYLITTLIVWVFAAFGEELLFQGYYMKRFAELFGNTKLAWLSSALFISIYFGVSHSYQGPAGIIAITMSGLIHAVLFYFNRKNLAILVFAHGFYDMIGLTLIYLNMEHLLLDWWLSI